MVDKEYENGRVTCISDTELAKLATAEYDKYKKVWRNNQMSIDKIEVAKEKFGKLIEEQLARVERMKADKDFIDYASLPVIKIGICGGDGNWPCNYCSGSENFLNS